MNIRYEDLVQKCRRCAGKGRVRDNSESAETVCKTCDGKGETMTETGQAMYKFIKFLKGKGLLS
jgi:DnaJ-class molecular chaperone